MPTLTPALEAPAMQHDTTGNPREFTGWIVGRRLYLTEPEAQAAADARRELGQPATAPEKIALVEKRETFDVWIVEQDGERLFLTTSEKSAEGYASVTRRDADGSPSGTVRKAAAVLVGDVAEGGAS
jgi:hypothetical protein